MKGIGFCEEMRLALVEGRKTETRRVIKPQPLGTSPAPVNGGFSFGRPYGCDDEFFKPKYKPGEVCFVQETWGCDDWEYVAQYKAEPWRGTPCSDGAKVHYLAFENELGTAHIFPKGYWKSPRFMPAWAARTFVRIESDRAERLQEITNEGAHREGVAEWAEPVLSGPVPAYRSPRELFVKLWDRLHPKPPYDWASNPYVFVYGLSLAEGGGAG